MAAGSTCCTTQCGCDISRRGEPLADKGRPHRLRLAACLYRLGCPSASAARVEACLLPS